MADRSRKRRRDPKQLTKLVEAEDKPRPPKRQKNPAAVELGKLGGKNGGKATAEAITPKKRQEIARKAAAALWKAARRKV